MRIRFPKSKLDITDQKPAYRQSAFYATFLKISEAQQLFQSAKALSMSPSSGYPHMFLGVIYLAQRKYGEALKASELAIFFEPNFDQAAAEYEKALRHNPDFMTSDIGLTATYSLLGMDDTCYFSPLCSVLYPLTR
jgi:tetratricopeptide (TPR) repeat protein